jgi:hypothetical protein
VLINKSHGGAHRQLSNCHTRFNLNSILHKNYPLAEILSKDIFLSMFTKELCDGFCRHKYPYYIATSQ